jgi:hypothetical protein
LGLVSVLAVMMQDVGSGRTMPWDAPPPVLPLPLSSLRLAGLKAVSTAVQGLCAGTPPVVLNQLQMVPAMLLPAAWGVGALALLLLLLPTPPYRTDCTRARVVAALDARLALTRSGRLAAAVADTLASGAAFALLLLLPPMLLLPPPVKLSIETAESDQLAATEVKELVREETPLSEPLPLLLLLLAMLLVRLLQERSWLLCAGEPLGVLNADSGAPHPALIVLRCLLRECVAACAG